LLVRHEIAISTVILEFTRSPCVLPQVPYRDVRRWQRRGAKLSGQYNFNHQRLAAESWERLRLPAGRRSSVRGWRYGQQMWIAASVVRS